MMHQNCKKSITSFSNLTRHGMCLQSNIARVMDIELLYRPLALKPVPLFSFKGIITNEKTGFFEAV